MTDYLDQAKHLLTLTDALDPESLDQAEVLERGAIACALS